MSLFFTKEITQAVVDVLQAASLSFSPKVVQRGDLAFIPEPTLSTILPAVLVRGVETEITMGESDAGGFLVENTLNLRVVAVREFTEDEQVWDSRVDTADEIGEAIAATFPDLGASITGCDIIIARPTGLELSPPEDDLVSLYKDRRLYAVAVTLEVQARSTR